MTRYSNKPCPGCKQVKDYRHNDEVCDDCKNKLKNYDALVESLSQVDDNETMVFFGKIAHCAAMMDIYSSMQDFLEQEYEAGLWDGQNFISRMVSGDVSINELIKTEKKRDM